MPLHRNGPKTLTVCGTVPCRQPSCSVCGVSHCTTNHGGGGSNPPTSPDPPTPPNDSRIFPQCDPGLDAPLQNLLTKLCSTVSGVKLLEKINSLLKVTNKNVYILYTHVKPDGSGANEAGRTFYRDNGDVCCYIFIDDLPTLYEELGHALQSENHPHAISIHREMEVKMMVYDFCKENEIVPLGDKEDWKIIDDYSNGKASANKAKRALQRLGYDTSGFDPNTFHTNNLNELR